MFREGDVWICMEVMDTSVDKFYARAFKNNHNMPETMLVQIAFSVVSALHYLHTKLKVIHRDVKPSNILISVSGKVKMCDFGISGYLVDSVAKETTKKEFKFKFLFFRGFLKKCNFKMLERNLTGFSFKNNKNAFYSKKYS